METLKPFMILMQFANNQGGTPNSNAFKKQRIWENYKDRTTKPFIRNNILGTE